MLFNGDFSNRTRIHFILFHTKCENSFTNGMTWMSYVWGYNLFSWTIFIQTKKKHIALRISFISLSNTQFKWYWHLSPHNVCLLAFIFSLFFAVQFFLSLRILSIKQGIGFANVQLNYGLCTSMLAYELGSFKIFCSHCPCSRKFQKNLIHNAISRNNGHMFYCAIIWSQYKNRRRQMENDYKCECGINAAICAQTEFNGHCKKSTVLTN